jgi:hypothetical protein
MAMRLGACCCREAVGWCSSRSVRGHSARVRRALASRRRSIAQPACIRFALHGAGRPGRTPAKGSPVVASLPRAPPLAGSETMWALAPGHGPVRGHVVSRFLLAVIPSAQICRCSGAARPGAARLGDLRESLGPPMSGGFGPVGERAARNSGASAVQSYLGHDGVGSSSTKSWPPRRAPA